MRDFAKFPPTFWTSEQAREIRAIEKPSERAATFLLGAYLKTNPHATMIGLYRLPLLFVVHELGMEPATVRKAFDHLQRVGFAAYEEAAEAVWVYGMAREQVIHGQRTTLAPNDYNVKACRQQYAAAPRCSLLKAFFEHYRAVLHLEQGRDEGPQTTPDLFDLGKLEGGGAPPSKGPPAPLRGEGEGEGEVRVLESGADSSSLATLPRKGSIVHRGPRGTSKGALHGEDLGRFEIFWTAFAYKDGKNDAVGAWIEAKIDQEVFESKVLPAAMAEAQKRDGIRQRGGTPIMAQGWISRARYEDESLLEVGRKMLERQGAAELRAARVAAEVAPQISEAEVLTTALDLAARLRHAVPPRGPDETALAYSGRVHRAAIKQRVRLGGAAQGST